jgi:hypothetical protein
MKEAAATNKKTKPAAARQKTMKVCLRPRVVNVPPRPGTTGASTPSTSQAAPSTSLVVTKASAATNSKRKPAVARQKTMKVGLRRSPRKKANKQLPVLSDEEVQQDQPPNVDAGKDKPVLPEGPLLAAAAVSDSETP